MKKNEKILYHYCSVETFFNIIKIRVYGYQILKNQMIIKNVWSVENM